MPRARFICKMKMVEHAGPLSAAVEAQVCALYEAIFGEAPAEKVRARLREKSDLLTLVFEDEHGRAVAYKIGYRQTADTFYSWIGGVLPECRGQGLAARLMLRQHAWAAERGYRFVETKTLNRWRKMLIINLQHGFDIVETLPGSDGALRILLRKTLLAE
jgi:predicted GNAT superfamily acetyltransferase